MFKANPTPIIGMKVQLKKDTCYETGCGVFTYPHEFTVSRVYQHLNRCDIVDNDGHRIAQVTMLDERLVFDMNINLTYKDTDWDNEFDSVCALISLLSELKYDSTKLDEYKLKTISCCINDIKNIYKEK